jgi:hypothetical protein
MDIFRHACRTDSEEALVKTPGSFAASAARRGKGAPLNLTPLLSCARVIMVILSPYLEKVSAEGRSALLQQSHETSQLNTTLREAYIKLRFLTRSMKKS